MSVFLAQKVDIRPLKLESKVKFWPHERVILTIFVVKKSLFWTLRGLFYLKVARAPAKKPRRWVSIEYVREII